MKLTESQQQEYLDELVRTLCKMQSTIHSIDKLSDQALFYKNHKQKLLNMENSLSTILNETTIFFGFKTTDSFCLAVKSIDDVAGEITYREESSENGK